MGLMAKETQRRRWIKARMGQEGERGRGYSQGLSWATRGTVVPSIERRKSRRGAELWKRG